MEKPLVLYHADCTDGFAAAFAAYLRCGDSFEYVPVYYNDKRWDVTTTYGRGVYILDFSFPRYVMDDILEHANHVVWLDHHKSAFEMWVQDYYPGIVDISEQGKLYAKLDDNKSGAVLAWEYFHPGYKVPVLFSLIDDRDRWQFKFEGTREVHAALASHKPWNFEHWRKACLLRNNYGTEYEFNDHNFVKRLMGEGVSLLRMQDRHVDQMVKQARPCVVGAFKGLAVNAMLYQSEVGAKLAQTSGTYGLAYSIGADNQVRCSFRSAAPYSVEAIARDYGGGGHLTAAGCTVSVETLLEWLR